MKVTNQIKKTWHKEWGEVQEKIQTYATAQQAEGPIVQNIQTMIEKAVALRASDIHLEGYSEKNIRIRMRIDGQLLHYRKLNPTEFSEMLTRIKVLAKMDISKNQVPQDGSFINPIGNQYVDIRVSMVPCIYKEKAVLRILDSQQSLMNYQELGFSEKQIRTIKQLIHQTNGLILTTGPTGSGKTTTLYRFLEDLKQESLNIMTIEDPVERKISYINQMQVNEKTGLGFSKGLRAILRQDPDVIMLGEIRDALSAQTAFRAALTGHLVFSTLHTNNAIASFFRLLDMGLEKYQIVGALRCIISQKLVRKLCPYCKESSYPDTNACKIFNLEAERPVYIQHKGGCEHCQNTGILGRKGVFEMLEINTNMKKAMQNFETGETLTKSALQSGWVPFKTILRSEIIKGEISIIEGLRQIENED